MLSALSDYRLQGLFTVKFGIPEGRPYFNLIVTITTTKQKKATVTEIGLACPTKMSGNPARKISSTMTRPEAEPHAKIHSRGPRKSRHALFLVNFLTPQVTLVYSLSKLHQKHKNKSQRRVLDKFTGKHQHE